METVTFPACFWSSVWLCGGFEHICLCVYTAFNFNSVSVSPENLAFLDDLFVWRITISSRQSVTDGRTLAFTSSYALTLGFVIIVIFFSNLSIWWDGNEKPSCWRSEEGNEVLTNLNQILSKPGIWNISKHGLYNFFTPLNHITEYLIMTGSLISMSPFIWYLPPHDHTLESKLKILPHNFRGLNSCSFGTMRLSKAS